MTSDDERPMTALVPSRYGRRSGTGLAHTRDTRFRESQRSSDRLREAVVFCTLAVLGAALLIVVLVAHVDFYFPLLFFVAVSFIAKERYLDVSHRGRRR